jgi:hypothetical protein
VRFCAGAAQPASHRGRSAETGRHRSDLTAAAPGLDLLLARTLHGGTGIIWESHLPPFTSSSFQAGLGVGFALGGVGCVHIADDEPSVPRAPQQQPLPIAQARADSVRPSRILLKVDLRILSARRNDSTIP